MRHPLLFAIAVLELLVPRRVIDWGEAVAYVETGEARLRDQAVTAARLEGLVLVVIFLDADRLRGKIGPLFVMLGAVLALSPRRTLDAVLAFCYENAADVELKSWVLPASRLLGLGSLVFGLREIRRSSAEEAAGPESTAQRTRTSSKTRRA
ncbi:hypothetical protein ACKVMT_16670 [Halobacteriales archaeon Cl-PHB]